MFVNTKRLAYESRPHADAKPACEHGELIVGVPSACGLCYQTASYTRQHSVIKKDMSVCCTLFFISVCHATVFIYIHCISSAFLNRAPTGPVLPIAPGRMARHDPSCIDVP